ncbi:DUF1963 domain-containing protein [Microcoleus sp. FACHB-SPT15]|uniref:DUF1963 domain-containing protein n=1 Tax=Microcoleus sp. FACHB-SPT15 TaxID=2692830 RepID=UPI001782F7ED|nr:DUF1963 domain-containing protein [Microcoleus sp. FACHB-SPT15]MBD1809388.1 DUF1963 domain-containing protein [Microcoleus sp. FACHB-SPT15]
MTESDLKLEQLKQKLSNLRRSAWKPIVREGDGALTSNFLFENNITVTGDKLGGWPEWVQYPEYPDCPTCHQPMKPFVFQIDSEDNLPYMWGDVGVGYLIQCSNHKEQLAFLWQCG